MQKSWNWVGAISLEQVGKIVHQLVLPDLRKCGNWEKELGEIMKTVKDSAYHIVDYKGATYFAIGQALVAYRVSCRKKVPRA